MSVSLSLGRVLSGKELTLDVTREGNQVKGAVYNARSVKLASLEVTLPTLRQPSLIICAFYVHTRMNPDEFTPRERDAGKGLGKLMLCALMNHLKLNDATSVELQAAGGAVPPGYDPSKEDMAKVDAYLKNYPKFLSELEHDVELAKRHGTMQMDETAYRNKLKAAFYIAALENQKLIQYYRGYGFEILEGTEGGLRADMKSTVGKILAACGTSGGRRKTYRRRGRKRTQRRKAKRASSYSA